VAVLVLACLFYPMAFLSVAIHDSVTAANPLLVVPSIIKVSGKYLMALLLLVLTAAVQWFGGLAVTKFFPEGSTTHAMGEFLAMIGVMAFVSFLTLYLLIIVVHLLGLIFLTSKDDLGWLRS
jgi:hypothetical protein